MTTCRELEAEIEQSRAPEESPLARQAEANDDSSIESSSEENDVNAPD